MNKVYIVMAYGGYYEESCESIVKIFATESDAEAFKELFLNSPELNEDYGDLHSAYVVGYDVE